MKAQPLASKRRHATAIAQAKTTAAPVRGWNTRDPLAAMDPMYAVQLDNWLPKTGNVQLRDGAVDHVTGFGGGTAIVKSVLAWRGASSQKLFACTDSGIYDATTAGVAGAVVQARTSGECIGVNFNTTGQSYLVTINGVDDLAYTNGSTWTTLANFAINGGGTLLTKDIVNVNCFKRSLYFLEKNSLNFYYLPIDSITGTVSKFPLGALFNKGGYLVAMGTWTIDGGFGADDYAVFLSSEGQAVVYKGTDPSNSSTWALNGVYDLSPVLGANCLCHYGGDLLVMTRRGVFSMSRILKDTMMAPNSALSDVIGEAFQASANLAGSYKGWSMCEYPDQSLLICNIPQNDYGVVHQYVLNTKTQAWCRFKGWDGYSMVLFQNNVYLGMLGKVAKIFVPGNDFTASITAEAQTAFHYFTPRGAVKDWKAVRANLAIGGKVAVNVALKTEFQDTVDYGTAVFNNALQSRWDSSQWDTAGWSSEPTARTEWVTCAADSSYASAVCLRVIARDATVIWSATDQTYESGSLM